MTALRTEEVECLLHCLVPNSVKVLGVFPADKVPHIDNEPKPCCFVLNTDVSGQSGEHWLAFHHDGSTLVYFDSYGMDLEMYTNVHSSLLARGLVCRSANSEMLQSPDTFVCGHYCVYFLYFRAKYPRLPNECFGRMLSVHKSLVDRDKAVLGHIRRLVALNKCADAMSACSGSRSDTQTCVCRRI
jgi:hypothetical protein